MKLYEAYKKIISGKSNLYVLEGDTCSGKTALLNVLKYEHKGRCAVLLCDDVVEDIMSASKKVLAERNDLSRFYLNMQTGFKAVNIFDSATVTASLSPELSIIKSVSPTTVVENGTVTYTFVLRNSGNTEAGADDNVSLTDTFDPILSDISVTYNGTILAEGVNYTYDEATGVFATIPGQITIPAATFTQDPVSGIWTVTPGESVLTVTGTI